SVMARAIYDLHGGMVNVRKLAGLELMRGKESDYPDAASAKAAFDAILKNHPELKNEPPTIKWMMNHGYYVLLQSIDKHVEGGYRALHAQYNPGKSLRRINGFWSDYNNVKNEARLFIQTHGYLPSLERLKKMYSSLASGITKNGGVTKLRADLAREGVVERTHESGELHAILSAYVGRQ
ncbi:MAG TPA: hypothetical protein VK158_00690, partial [Acidobacteriota bacterium]|nr:hypothetical protein [Acidobacteriota bacterium]